MAQKIPATVITGFLGAGKTTLVRHLLENANGKRIALIINEFGNLGVDGEILKGCGDETCSEADVVELSNGCICCTVADDFIPSMEALIARAAPPDHIVIETSGLALPQPLVRAFSWPEIRTKVTVDGVVTVVDGPAAASGQFAHDLAAVDAQRAADDGLDHETPLSELFEDQLACADMIVINKSDLMGTGQAGLAAQLKAGARSGVQVLSAEHGRIDPGVLLGLGVGAEDDLEGRHEVHHHHHDRDHDHDHDHDTEHDHDHHDHHHHDDHGHDAFQSFVVDLPEQAEPADLTAKVERVIRDHGILRLKGFAAIAGKPMRLTLQAVGPRVDTYFDRPFAAGEARGTRLVVIGQTGLDEAAIRADLS
ncbi:MAG: cobalamin biosynthesis protein CobW [Pseudomonadota bacterium]